MKRNIIRFCFHRDYQRYTGGHQKFRDYIEHTAKLPNVECHLFTKNQCSVMPELFSSLSNVVVDDLYKPESADVVFLAGMDWQSYLPHKQTGQKIVNLIQHVRHGDSENPLHQFLQYKALRICVSEEVRQAILPYANGECVTITMGHKIPQIVSEKHLQLYILGKKNPKLALQIETWAKKKNINVKVDLGLVSRAKVFNNFARANVSLVLPNPTEGFFLPGIEAMALSERVVVPDCIGNREYCKPGANITICNYDFESCTSAITSALLRLKTPMQQFEKYRGNRLAHSYNMDAEREEYQKLLLDKHII